MTKKAKRKYKFLSQDTLNKLEQAFSLGCSDAEACIFADIPTSTFYLYQKNHPDFLERKALLKEKVILKARTVIVRALQNEDIETAKWFLERKRKDEFSSRQEMAQQVVQTVYVTKQDEDDANEHIDSFIQD